MNILLLVLQIIREGNAELQERTGKFRKQAVAIAGWYKRILRNHDVLLRTEVCVSECRKMKLHFPVGSHDLKCQPHSMPCGCCYGTVFFFFV